MARKSVKPTPKVRTGTPDGDDSAAKGAEFDASGGGVVEKEKRVGSDPNAGVSLGHRPGAV